MSYEDKDKDREHDRVKKRLRRAGSNESPSLAIAGGIVPAVSNVRRAFVEGNDMSRLPDDQIELINQMHRRHHSIGNGLVGLVEKFLLDESKMNDVIECMTIRDARDLLDLGVKMQRSAVAAMGSRNPTDNDEDNRRNLAGKILKDITLLDRLHEMTVDDDVDQEDIVEGVFVNVNIRDEVVKAGEMIVTQPHQEHHIPKATVIKKKQGQGDE